MLSSAYKGSEYLGDFLQSQYYTVSIPSNVVSMKVDFIILLVLIIFIYYTDFKYCGIIGSCSFHSIFIGKSPYERI